MFPPLNTFLTRQDVERSRAAYLSHIIVNHISIVVSIDCSAFPLSNLLPPSLSFSLSPINWKDKVSTGYHWHLSLLAYAFSYVRDSSHIFMEMFAQLPLEAGSTDGYVAIGFSKDNLMV